MSKHPRTNEYTTYSDIIINHLDSKPTIAQNDLKPSPKIRSRTRPPVVISGSEATRTENPVVKNHERKQNKENNQITTPAVKVSSIDLETKGINVLCKETAKKNTEKSTVPPVPKLRKSKTKTENDSRISSEQQEAEKVRIRKKKADPKVSIFNLTLIILITLYSRYLSENHRHSRLPLYANLIRFSLDVILCCEFATVALRTSSVNKR